MRADGSALAGDPRSVRRWLQRVVVPIFLRYLFLILLIILVVGAWGAYARHEWMKAVVRLAF